jgi:perosamine synthetase
MPAFGQSRDDLMSFLRQRGVDTRTFFCPMNLQPFLREQAGFRHIACPVAEEMWRSGLYLPSSVTLTNSEIDAIASAIREARDTDGRV